MMEMTLQPGSIIIWKEFDPLAKLWYKLKKKPLPFNMCKLVYRTVELISDNTGFDNIFDHDCMVYEPRKQYSTLEKYRLNEIKFSNLSDPNRWREYKGNTLACLKMLNEVRPNTFDMTTVTFANVGGNKYYKRIYAKKVEY